MSPTKPRTPAQLTELQNARDLLRRARRALHDAGEASLELATSSLLQRLELTLESIAQVRN